MVQTVVVNGVKYMNGSKKNEIAKKELMQVCFVCALSFFSGINNIMDLIISVIVCIILVCNMNRESFFYYYPVLMLFESQFLLPLGLGSIIRVYFALLILKILLSKNETTKVKSIFLISAVPLLILELYRITYNIYNFSILMNIIMICLIHTKIMNDTRMLGKELLYLSIAVFFTGLYGIIKVNYFNTAIFTGAVSYHFGRLSGTVNDPNYSSIFFNLGIFSLFFCNIKLNKKIKAILIVSLYIFLIMTVSIQGIIGNFLFLLAYLFLVNKKKLKLSNIFTFFIVIIIIITIYNSNLSIIQPLKYRLDNITHGNKDIAEMTSGRSVLRDKYLSVFNKKSFFEKLTGRILLISHNSTREEFIKLNGGVSHNAYVDMLFEIGIIGTIWILISFLYSSFVYLKLYKITEENAYLGVVFLKFILLYAALGISIFPYRYFLYVYLF